MPKYQHPAPRPYLIPEIRVPGRPLGRGVHHDPESLRYLLQPAVEFKSVKHERHIPTLNQLRLSACVGNAFTGVLGTGPTWDALKKLFPVFPTLDEAFAVAFWSECLKYDGGVGYPPENEGTYGLSAGNVGKKDGYISGFMHATSVAAAHTAIQRGAFMLGIKWFSDMDEPTSEGIVKPTGYVRGGHEVDGDEYDAGRDLWWFNNSWGNWGLNGRFALDTPSLGYLLSQQGDITLPIPLTEPAPTPTPVTNINISMTPERFADMNKWAPRSSWWWSQYSQRAAAAWEASTK